MVLGATENAEAASNSNAVNAARMPLNEAPQIGDGSGAYGGAAASGTVRKPILISLKNRISKTKMCIQFSRGNCLRGNLCSFAHSPAELREPPNLAKTRLCDMFKSTGTCSMNDRCR